MERFKDIAGKKRRYEWKEVWNNNKAAWRDIIIMQADRGKHRESLTRWEIEFIINDFIRRNRERKFAKNFREFSTKVCFR